MKDVGSHFWNTVYAITSIHNIFIDYSEAAYMQNTKHDKSSEHKNDNTKNKKV